jgi:hypothetical protein
MNNATIQLKIKQRLNKLASNDYDNIECWQLVEAFNKGQVDWCRRNLHGLNVVKEGDEQSTSRIDDLQVLLEETALIMLDKTTYYETVTSIPSEYLRYKRISVMATNECCPEPRRMVVFLAEQGNVDILLKDVNKRPNFDWAETFATFAGDKLQVYTNGEFEIDKVKFTYYRQPIKIQINGCVDPYTQVQSTIDVECEFKDDLVELLIDEAAKIIAGDIESMVQMQRNNQSVEGNN